LERSRHQPVTSYRQNEEPLPRNGNVLDM